MLDIMNIHPQTALYLLQDGIDLQNRRVKFKLYRNCFHAHEAVTFMLENGWTQERDEAVLFGESLQSNQLIEHISDPDILFQDDDQLFVFIDQEERNDDEDGISHTSGHPLDTIPIVSIPRPNFGLFALAGVFQTRVKRMYNARLDREGFYGSDAVDCLVSCGLASTASDAVKIGQTLEDNDIITNPKDNRKFGDGRVFFAFNGFNKKQWQQDLFFSKRFMESNIQTKTHSHHMKLYRDTFTGHAMVDFLAKKQICSSRQDAVFLARAVSIEYNLWRDRFNADAEFTDSTRLYIFTKDLLQKMASNRQLRI